MADHPGISIEYEVRIHEPHRIYRRQYSTLKGARKGFAEGCKRGLTAYLDAVGLGGRHQAIDTHPGEECPNRQS